MSCKMTHMDNNGEWREDDATWALLEKARPKEANARFADDVVRAVRTMPERKSSWAGLFGYAPWVGAAACAVVAAFLLINQPEKVSGDTKVVVSSSEEEWSEIEDVADVEILSAAAEHLDDFSDDELIVMIGL